MNRQDLIDTIAEDTEASKATTTRFPDSLITIVQNKMAKDGAMKLTGFGTFEKAIVAAHTGRNPKTGAPIKIPSTHKPRFTPRTTFKDLVKGWTMSKHPDLNGTALTLLCALDRGEVRGIRVLSERVAGRPLCDAINLTMVHEYLDETRHPIDRGYLSRKPAGTSIWLSLTRKSRRTLHPGTPFWPTPVAWALGASMLAAGVTGHAPMSPEQSRVLLMGTPVLTGLARVRDPQTGTDYFVPCNPCAAPTLKAPMLGSIDAAPETTGKAATRPQPSVLTKLDVHTVTTLAIPVEADVIPADSAQLTDDMRPVAVAVVGPAAAAPVATTASSSLRSLPFSSSIANLNDEAKRNLSELLPLAITTERILIRDRTDSTGTVAGDHALAIVRAATVRTAFTRDDIDPRKLKVSYYVTCFIASNDTEAGRNANRHVEVELVMPVPAVVFSKWKLAMNAGDRDWYRERATKAMQDHYCDPKVFRGSYEVRVDQPRITFLQFVIANALPCTFLIVMDAIWQIAHGVTPYDALLMATQWLKSFMLNHLVLCLLMVAGVTFYMTRPCLAGIAYVWIGIGFLCFVAFDYFDKKPAATAVQQAGEPPHVATMSVPENRRECYETPDNIDDRPVIFIMDTGAGVTSVPGSLVKPLGITSCEPR